MAGTFFSGIFGRRFFSSETNQTNGVKSAVFQNIDLTIGVEFEFAIVRYAFPEAIGPMGVSLKPNTYGADRVRAVLSRPLQASCDVCSKGHVFSLPINQSGSNFANWTVETDKSIELAENERSFVPPQHRQYCQEYPVELKSRILQAGQRLQTSQSAGPKPHMHEITYQEEIRVVLEALAAAFGAPEGVDSERRLEHLVVNNSCGLHVHVGNQDRGFPIETVKNVLATYTACERVIDELQAADRISDTYILQTPWEEIESKPPMPPSYEGEAWWDFYLADAFHPEPVVYNRSLRGIAILNAMKISLNTAEKTWYGPHRYPLAYRASGAPIPQAATEFHCASFIDLIAQAPSIASLQTLQSGAHHNITVNIGNLESATVIPKPTRTIEFRQHTGTVSCPEVIHWIEVVTSLVRFAHQMPTDMVLHLCENSFGKSSFFVGDFLERIGASRSTRDHYGELASNVTFRQACTEKDLARIELLAPGDPLKELCHQVQYRRAYNSSREAVEQAIFNKVCHGGYGQIHPRELHDLAKLYQYDIDELLVEKLAIGGKGKECFRVGR